jgi:phosphatidylserine/phosphatidylglycerophosphate/cardiolipin synthase-like enzyme
VTVLATAAPQPGQIVRVRSRQCLVEATTPPPAPGERTLVRLSCLDDDAQGTTLEVLWESEVDAVPVARPTWQRAAERGFDAPQLFASYLHALRWNTVTSRALSAEPGPRASLHAKCIVVDRRWSFITSANFTEAAQERNIEAGVLIEDSNLSAAVENQLDGLVTSGSVRRIDPLSRTRAP